MNPRICYVSAAYLGDRKFMDPRFQQDRWWYLRAQVDMLQRLEHSLAHVLFVINTDVPLDVPPDISEAATVVQRPNVGMSYGAFDHAFKLHRGDFTHYIFNEDDYLFTQPHFDSLLAEEMERRPRVQMLCGAAYPFFHIPVHAAVSCMIAGTPGLEAILSRSGGKLPHFHDPKVPSPYREGYQSQAMFGHELLGAGYGLEDWLLRWSTAFRMDGMPHLQTRWFSRRGDARVNPHSVEADFSVPSMVVGVQCVGVEHPIHTGYGLRNGVIHADGSVTFCPGAQP